jgi:uncharacterized damage-inducible protein DinB
MAVPEQAIEWSPHPNRFTFGDIVRHLAAVERYVYAEVAAGRPIRYPGHSSFLASGLVNVVRYYDELHVEARAILHAIDPAAYASKCETPVGTPISLWKWIRLMTEHEIHHRGQLYLMLTMVGVRAPPVLELTSEQLLELSTRL